MKIKQKIKKAVQNVYNTAKIATKTAIYTAPFWLPGILETKPIDLQATKENVLQEYGNIAEVKLSQGGYNFYGSMVADIGKGYHFDTGLRSANGNNSGKVAILGKNLGIEASADFNKNKSLTLEGMAAGLGIAITGNRSNKENSVKASLFRAEQLGKTTLYGKIEGNEDNIDVTAMGFYIGPKIKDLTIIPLAYGSKSLTSDNYYFMTGAVFSAGKLSTSITTGTTDFKNWTPSVKFKVKF